MLTYTSLTEQVSSALTQINFNNEGLNAEVKASAPRKAFCISEFQVVGLLLQLKIFVNENAVKRYYDMRSKNISIFLRNKQIDNFYDIAV